MQIHDNTQTVLREILACQLIAKEIKNRQDELKSQLTIEPGEKINILTDWGESLGSFSRPKINFSAVVDDPAVVTAEMDEDETDVAINLDEEAALINYLVENELWQFLTIIPKESAVKARAAAALNQWRKTGEVPVGWRLVEKAAAAPRATATKLAKEMVADFMAENAAALSFAHVGELPAGKRTA